MWANLHLLFWLSLIPFVTAWVGQNPSAPLPTAVYAGVLLCAGTSFTLLGLALIAVNGKESTRVFYTRDIQRNPPMLRFYDCPEALIVAFGGQLESKIVTKKPVAKKSSARKSAVKSRVKSRVKKPVAKKRRVKKAA